MCKNNTNIILELKKEGKTLKQISEITGFTISKIRYWLRGGHHKCKQKHNNSETLRKNFANLHKEGYSILEISKILEISCPTIYKHVPKNERIPNKKNKTVYKHPFYKKTYQFLIDEKITNKKQTLTNKKLLLQYKIYKFQGKQMNDKTKFTVDDIINKYGEHTKCYLTGRPIDIYKTSSYHFDHIVPKSRGGDNSLDNLGIACKDANQSKHNMTQEEYLKLCREVLENFGYEVISPSQK